MSCCYCYKIKLSNLHGDVVLPLTSQVVFAIKLSSPCVGINGLNDVAEFDIDQEYMEGKRVTPEAVHKACSQ